MFNFIKNQWVMGKYTVEQVNNCMVKGFITQTQVDEILAIGQILGITISSQ